jgi:ribosomal protein L32
MVVVINLISVVPEKKVSSWRREKRLNIVVNRICHG